MTRVAKTKLWMRALATTAVVSVMVTSGSARADHYGPPRSTTDGLAAGLGLISLTTTAVPGLITAVGTAASGSLGWRVAGYVFGGLNLAAGALGMVASSIGSSKVGAAISGAHLLIGTANLGLSIYRSVNADRQVDRVSLVPITGRGAKGQLFAGAGIEVVGF